MDEKREANRALWNLWATLHERSALYNVPAFRAGASTLLPADRELVGEVAGKSLLHLQCHFGLDTLSWARLGARVTGMDISDEGINAARRLAEELNLPARFIRCDLYDLPEHLSDTFDIVYTSYGVLTWLGDLPAWGRIVARFLKPGGRFYLLESHPFGYVFDEKIAPDGTARIAHSYFQRKPARYLSERSYAMGADESHPPMPSWEWSHTISDIINALACAGLRIEQMREYPASAYSRSLFQASDGGSLLDSVEGKLPVVLAIVAFKER